MPSSDDCFNLGRRPQVPTPNKASRQSASAHPRQNATQAVRGKPVCELLLCVRGLCRGALRPPLQRRILPGGLRARGLLCAGLLLRHGLRNSKWMTSLPQAVCMPVYACLSFTETDPNK